MSFFLKSAEDVKVSVSLSLQPNQFPNPAGSLWLSSLGCVLHYVLMTKWIKVILKPLLCVISPHFVYHCLYLPTLYLLLIKQECPKYWVLNMSYVEQPVPGHGLLSVLAAVHLVTVAEEYISASHFLVTMPAICLPFWRDGPEDRTP